MNKNGKFKYTVNQAAQLRFKREIFFCKSIHELTQKQKDMTAEELGMQVFLLKDCIINKSTKDITGYPQGGFDELIEYIKNI